MLGPSPWPLAGVLLFVAVGLFARFFLVHLVDREGGVEAIALRSTAGWHVEEHLPSEEFGDRGFTVLVRGSENGLDGAGLLHALADYGPRIALAAALAAVATAAARRRRSPRDHA
jgi:hypothetical protein